MRHRVSDTNLAPRLASPHSDLSAAAPPRLRGRLQLALAALFLLITLAACAPAAFGSANVDQPIVEELRKAAEIIYHRMELGRLELGAYTTTPLVDADIPEGAMLTLINYDLERGSTYELLLTSTHLGGAGFRITPRGVSRANAV